MMSTCLFLLLLLFVCINATKEMEKGIIFFETIDFALSSLYHYLATMIFFLCNVTVNLVDIIVKLILSLILSLINFVANKN